MASTSASSNTSRWTVTISHPEPSDGNVCGLEFYIRRKFASIGLVVLDFREPTYGTLNTEGREFRLIHMRFMVRCESNDEDPRYFHEFRLEPREHEDRVAVARNVVQRIHDFADAEEAYYAQDKETRGPLKNLRDKNGKGMVELVHTENEDRRKERFWKIKLIRMRQAPTLVARTSAVR